MRSLDGTKVMVPVAAYTSLRTADGSPGASPMLSLNQSSYQSQLCRPQHVTEAGFSAFHPFFYPSENGFRLSPWIPSFKGSPYIEARPSEVQGLGIPHKVEPSSPDASTGHVSTSDQSTQHLTQIDSKHLVETQSVNEQALSDTKISCRGSGTQMNGADDLTMTGSSNPRAEQLNWLADVATGGNRGAQNLTSSPGHDKITAPGPPVLHNTEVMSSTLHLPNTRSTFTAPLLATSPGEQRMYASPYHSHHSHHQTSAISGSGLSLYYSQAPRAAPYSSFYHGQYRPTTPYHQANSTDTAANPSRPSRPFFQVETYPTTLSSMGTNVQLQTTYSQLPHSPGYLQRTAATSSPLGLAAPPSSPRIRTPLQSRSVLISRSPEEMVPQDRDKSHLQISPNSPQLHREERRKSYKSPEPGLASTRQSPVCDTTQSTNVYLADFAASKDSLSQHNASSSHLGYRVPTGKEGSLKHRILRPPSINIVDPPPSAVPDAPLSAPPIRSRREPSPKQSRLENFVGYRSYSTSESFVLETSPVQMPTQPVTNRLSPSFAVPNCTSSLSVACSSPQPTNPPGCGPQLKYPPSFMKGSIIQLANNQLKQVEYLTTEDFVECGSLSSTLRIDSSTVINIEKTPASGSAKLGFSVGQNKIQITVEAPLEHPFFVYKQGWSSCSPERSLLRYGLACHKLKVGDTCISLTEKSEPSSESQKTSRLAYSDATPKPHFTVPTNIASKALIERPKIEIVQCQASYVAGSHNCKPTVHTNHRQQGDQTPISSVPSSNDKASTSLLPSSLQTNPNSRPVAPGKRKRHWSAPDHISISEEGPPSSLS